MHNHEFPAPTSSERSTVRPPVSTRHQLLPFSELSWDNFEQLCLRLAHRDEDAERCQRYGEAGQRQDGIDILVRLRSGQYHVWQVKRRRACSPSTIRTAVDEFLAGKWREKSLRFILAVQASLRSTGVADEIEKQCMRLRNLGIEFVALGGEELSGRLKTEPDLIEEFFGGDRSWVEEICGPEIAGRHRIAQASSVLSRYREWVMATTGHYVIPGINVPLTVSRCWIPLHASEMPGHAVPPQTAQEALDSYLRAGRGHSTNERNYDAEWLNVGLPRVVLLGGPGAGKSLLLRRLAHRETEGGRTVLLARLSFVAAGVYKHGQSFEESFLSVATDGSGLSPAEKRIVLENATLVLLDGLDECGSQRHAIADALVKWSVARADITVILTSRLVGHSAATLPGWPEFILCPQDHRHELEEFAINGVCREVFTDQNDHGKEVARRLERVITADARDREDGEYGIVRGVPLLFGFMVSLAVNGYDIPQTPQDLHNAVIQLLVRTYSQDRGTDAHVDETVAYEALYSFGWLLMHNPVRDFHDLLDETGRLLAKAFSEQFPVARRLAEHAFHFWEERRLIERLHHGAQEFATFTHLAFCEYTAARFVLNLGRVDLRTWVLETGSDPRWREVYVTATALGIGLSLVELLLDCDVPITPDSAGAILAADLCGACRAVGDDLLVRLLEHLLPSITSGLRESICAAATAALGLARQSPHLVGPWAKRLLLHEDEWTRSAGLALCLGCGDEYIDLDDLRSRYPDLLPRRRERSPFGGWMLEGNATHRFRSTVLLRATATLLAAGLTSTLRDGIRRMLDDVGLSSRQSGDLLRLLRESRHPELVDVVNQHYAKLTEHWTSLRWPDNVETQFLDVVLQLCCATDGQTPPTAGPFIHLAKLVHILRIGEMTAGDVWAHWRAPGREAETSLIIRGAMLAAGLEPGAVARDVLSIKEVLKGQELSLLGLLPQFPINGDWGKTKSIPDMSLRVLASAIDHPCQPIAVAAAEMILARAPGEADPDAFKQVLHCGRSYSLYILAQIGEQLWGRRTTLDLLCSRLEQEFTPGCKHLLANLPTLSDGKVDDRILSIIRRALTARNADVALKAAELCLEYASADSLVSDLRSALTHWKTHEEPYPTKIGVIPTSPRSTLVKALARRQALSVDELFGLYEDVRSDVRDPAKDQLLHLARNDRQIISRLLDGIQAGTVGLSTLSKIAEMPCEALTHEYDRLLGFLKSENRDVRVVMTQALKKKGFGAVTGRVELVSGMLNDSDADVRDAARRVLASEEFRNSGDTIHNSQLPSP